MLISITGISGQLGFSFDGICNDCSLQVDRGAKRKVIIICSWHYAGRIEEMNNLKSKKEIVNGLLQAPRESET